MTSPESRHSTIWKFVLDPRSEWIAMPPGARPIHAREQHGKVAIWAEVDPSALSVEHRFVAGMTGGPTPVGTYVGTAVLTERLEGLSGGPQIVVHVYDTGEERVRHV